METHYVAFDVETTGLSAAYGDRICEVGMVIAQGDEVLETYQSLVNPQRPISPGASRVNGLNDADVCDAPLFAEVAEPVLRRVNGAVLICHNAPFDLAFLDAELARLNRPWQPAGVIDTLALARQYFNFDSNSLPAIAARLEIKTPESHRALSDALTTFEVYRYFRHRLAINRLADEEDLAGSYTPAYRLADEEALPPSIQEALAGGKRLEIIYIDSNGQQTCRQITPRHVIQEHDYIYLVAYCHLRQAERHFRLDRIVAINT